MLSAILVLRRSGPCAPSGRIQAEHVDGVREKSFTEGRESPVLLGEGREEEEGPGSLIFIPP
jgi:hypothetical protein